jgi:site-specific recombinase XerD
MPGFHTGRPPRNKGFRDRADPPKIEEIIAVMRRAGDDAHGRRLRGLIVVLRSAGLRIHEALALAEGDLDHGRGALLVRRSSAGARTELRRTAVAAGVRRRFAPHQLRHAHPVEMAHEGVPLVVIQRQLGHSNLGITSVYLQGIDNAEIINRVHAPRASMIPVSTALRR